MMQTTIPGIPSTPVKVKPSITCGRCEHAKRMHYWRRDWLYCEITKSARTAFNCKRVKSRDAACQLFVSKLFPRRANGIIS